MTKEEAISACENHAADAQAVGAILALAGIAFSIIGPEVEKALGLPKDTLVDTLIVPQKQLLSALSAYIAVLENAAKGQLSPVVEEEWSEVIE